MTPCEVRPRATGAPVMGAAARGWGNGIDRVVTDDLLVGRAARLVPGPSSVCVRAQAWFEQVHRRAVAQDIADQRGAGPCWIAGRVPVSGQQRYCRHAPMS